MKVKEQVHFYPYIMPPNEAIVLFATKGMERQLGSASKPSWALLYIHIKSLNYSLKGIYHKTQDAGHQHEVTVAALLISLGILAG
jgi:hypothetical protein